MHNAARPGETTADASQASFSMRPQGSMSDVANGVKEYLAAKQQRRTLFAELGEARLSSASVGSRAHAPLQYALWLPFAAGAHVAGCPKACYLFGARR